MSAHSGISSHRQICCHSVLEAKHLLGSINVLCFSAHTGRAENVGRLVTAEKFRLAENNMSKLDPALYQSKSLQLCPVLLKLKRNCNLHHIMSRKGTTPTTSVPRFGIFCGAVQHTGPEGVDNLCLSEVAQGVSTDVPQGDQSTLGHGRA